MSAIYLDIIKDRLYTSPPRSRDRRSAQSALHRIADRLCRLMAPILPFTAEEIWQEILGLPGGAAGRPASVHLAELPARAASDEAGPARAAEAALIERWRRLFEIRAEIQKAIEETRRTKKIGSSLGARLILRADAETRALLDSFGEDLRFLLIVSAVRFDDSLAEGFVSERIPGFAVLVLPAEGTKCERCWNFTLDVGSDPSWPGACTRCARAIETMLAESA